MLMWIQKKNNDENVRRERKLQEWISIENVIKKLMWIHKKFTIKITE